MTELQPMGSSIKDPLTPVICIASSITSLSNWFQKTPYINEDETVGGELVFVSTGCNEDHAPFELCYQFPGCCLPGVSINESIHNDQVKAHKNWNANLPYESIPIMERENGAWPPKPLNGPTE